MLQSNGDGISEKCSPFSPVLLMCEAGITHTHVPDTAYDKLYSEPREVHDKSCRGSS